MSEHVYNAFFVDLFVRVSNTLAINMYTTFGYSVYRRVVGYYSGEEDAFGETRFISFRVHGGGGGGAGGILRGDTK